MKRSRRGKSYVRYIFRVPLGPEFGATGRYLGYQNNAGHLEKEDEFMSNRSLLHKKLEQETHTKPLI